MRLIQGLLFLMTLFLSFGLYLGIKQERNKKKEIPKSEIVELYKIVVHIKINALKTKQFIWMGFGLDSIELRLDEIQTHSIEAERLMNNLYKYFEK
jgi:hypothetical protein